MIFTESWLRELIDFPVSIEKLGEQLTMAGLEIESMQPCTAGFTGVIAARVLSAEPLPGSDKLKVCKVDTGSGTVTVVCGAPVVIPGRCYPLARPGASLPGGITLQTVSKKGVLSEGMLCSAAELGLTEQSTGLFELSDDVKPGTLLEHYLGLPDVQVEVSLTPNRGDCLGMRGLAREVAVLNNLVYRTPAAEKVAGRATATRTVKLAAGTACPRYCGRIIEQIDITRKTPITIAERLRRAGIRSINTVVDLTNYVMLETGQPMHVFDNDALQGEITVRLAKAGETFESLDAVTRTLAGNTLVIADQSGPVAMAGIIGGLQSAVSGNTRNIFIESAFFEPLAIMGRARQYGLHTDASHRYERGVDPELPIHAMERLSALILTVCGGVPGPVQESVNPADLPVIRTVTVRKSRIKRLLGISVPDNRIGEILGQLGFKLESSTAAGEAGWKVQVPTSRFDIALEADLIEEIARIYGYQNIKGTAPVIRMQMQAADPYKATLEQTSAVLTARGYREAINYSFVEPDLQERVGTRTSTTRLLNPISAEMAEMRQSLWPGLLQSLSFNIKRQQSSVRLFETGKLYLDSKAGGEIRVVAGITYGNLYKLQWDIKDILCDFYDLKSDMEALLAASGLSAEYPAVQHKALHPGQSAGIQVNDQLIGTFGMLHPDLQRHLSLPQPAYLFELELDKISIVNINEYNKISKYPAVKRDIAIVVDEMIAAADIQKVIKSAGSGHLVNLELFDVYRGEGIDSGKKSLALGLTFQKSSSTLTDEEADAAISDILHSLRQRFGALLRE